MGRFDALTQLEDQASPKPPTAGEQETNKNTGLPANQQISKPASL